MDKRSQCQKILEYMDEHGGISSREAMMRLNIMRLASRIADLKKRGYKISTEYQVTANGARYAVYYLEE